MIVFKIMFSLFALTCLFLSLLYFSYGYYLESAAIFVYFILNLNMAIEEFKE